MRGSEKPIEVVVCEPSYSAGRHRCSQPPCSSRCPLRSCWWHRCITTTLAAVLGSFTRVDITISNQSLVALRTESDSTSFTLFGSSHTMRSPPSPVAAPPTDVERRYPERSLSNRPLVFWSLVLRRASELTHLCFPKMTQAGRS